MQATQVVAYDHVPIISRGLDEALRRDAETDLLAYRKGILIYNGMKSAFLVPVLRKQFSDDMPVDVGDSFCAVDAWIAPPLASDVPLNRWTKNIKITETHALFYYSLKTTVALASAQPQIVRQEAIGDVDEMHRTLPSLL